MFALPGIEERCFICRACSLVTIDSAMPAEFCNKGLGENDERYQLDATIMIYYHK